jgi:hypothetical protein
MRSKRATCAGTESVAPSEARRASAKSEGIGGLAEQGRGVSCVSSTVAAGRRFPARTRRASRARTAEDAEGEELVVLAESIDTRRTRRTTEGTEKKSAVILSAAKDRRTVQRSFVAALLRMEAMDVLRALCGSRSCRAPSAERREPTAESRAPSAALLARHPVSG